MRVGKLGQPGFRVAGNGNDLAAVVADRHSRRFHFSRLAAVGNADDHIPRHQLAAGTVNGFRAVQKIGGRTGGGQQRSHIIRHMGRLADAGNVEAISLFLRIPDDLSGGQEVLFMQAVQDLLRFLALNFHKCFKHIHISCPPS